MDQAVLDRAGPGPVVVLPAASAPGHEYDETGRNAVAYYTALGATGVTVAPDPRVDAAAAAAAVRDAGLLVLPGGMPARLLDALAEPELRAAVEQVARDGVVSGSSAGAMVLGRWTVVPEPEPLTVAPGLAVVPDFAAVPHYAPGAKQHWIDALRERAPDLDVLGIPERSGVLLDGDQVTALGVAPSVLITADGTEQLSL